MNKTDIVGTWVLVSFTAETSDSKKFAPWGENPCGQIIYTDDGNMSVILTRKGRDKFAIPDPLGGTLEEIKQAFEDMDAYAGTYEINSKEKYITHHAAISRFPNWEGNNLIRYYDLKDDILTLKTPPMLVDGEEWVISVVWRRK